MNQHRINLNGREYVWANQWYDLETYLPAEHTIASQLNALLEEEKKKLEEEARKQEEYEAEAVEEFRRIKEKYAVGWYKEVSPISRLNQVLMEIDVGRILSEEDVQWLNDERVYQALGFYYEKLGRLASAGSYWRKAQNPQRAIEITQDKRSQSNSPTLTMRGGAFRDLRELDEAEGCGQAAIRLAPEDYHPYNLLGAVCYQRGLPEEGERYFETAKALGSPASERDNSIRSAVEKAGHDEKKRVVEYLLKKDPVRYVWARRYLRLAPYFEESTP